MEKLSAVFLNSRNILSAGSVSEDQFWLLIELSPIHSEKVINALRDHLVYGKSRKSVCEHHNVNAGYFSTSLNRINYINQVVALLLPYYTLCE